MKNFKKIIEDIFYVSRLTKIKKKKVRILFSAVVSNSISLADILIILSFSNILTDTVNIENEYLQIIFDNPVFIPIIVIFRYILNFVGKYNIFSLSKDVEQSLKVYLLEEVYKKGNYSLSDATYYIETLSVHIAYFFNAFANIASSFIQVVIFLAYLSYDNFQTISVFGVLVLLLYYPTKLLLSKGRLAMEDSFNFSRTTLRNIQRIIDNLYLVKILKTQENELSNFNNNLSNLYRAEKKKFIYSDVNATVPNFVAIFTFSLLLVVSRFKSLISLEFIGVTLRLVQTLASVNSALSMLVGSHVHLEKLFLVEENEETNKDVIIENDPSSSDAIKVTNLNFKFMNSNELFFSNLNLEFKKNKHYIITGINGTGKSTLLGILSGALNPTSGKIISSSQKVGYVGATPLILEDTLRENLTYGSKENVPDQILYELIKEFKIFNEDKENVLETIITNKTLSSGQMQKVSFIRALVGGCEIIFLDESTANLDVEAKKQISEILSTRLKSGNLTIINSTHNPEEFQFDHHYMIDIHENQQRHILQLK